MTEPFDRTFLRTLIEDVLAARSAINADTGGSGRRNAVRATFAAIEGDLWFLRQHVIETATSMNTLTPLAGMALREETYLVGNKGEVIRQVRSVPLLQGIRLIESQARLIAPEIRVRYDHAGWQALRLGHAIRNRITHPKKSADLDVSDDELAMVAQGIDWLLATTEYIMASILIAHKEHVAALKAVVAELTAGNPETLRAYEEALAASRGNE